MWLVAVGIVLVIGAALILALGEGGNMSVAYDDRPDVRIQADGPITADDLTRIRFNTAVRGYRADEVDALLKRLGEQLQQDSPAEPDQRPR